MNTRLHHQQVRNERQTSAETCVINRAIFMCFHGHLSLNNINPCDTSNLLRKPSSNVGAHNSLVDNSSTATEQSSALDAITVMYTAKNENRHAFCLFSGNVSFAASACAHLFRFRFSSCNKENFPLHFSRIRSVCIPLTIVFETDRHAICALYVLCHI